MTKKSSKRYLGRGGTHSQGMAPAPLPSSYSSAETYGNAVNGTVNSQMHRVFGNATGTASHYGQSNASVGIQGQMAASVHPLKGGRRRKSAKKMTRKSRGKGKCGGLFGPVLNQALVPFGILALQQSFGRKKSGNPETKKYFKNRSSRRR